MAQSDRMKEWADNLVNQPIDVNDDYGNLIMSVGLAVHQKRDETSSLRDPAQVEASKTVSGQHIDGKQASRSGM